MMNTRIFFLSFVFLFTSVKTNDVSKTPDNFGPYNVNYNRYEVCKGPKVGNAADFSTNLTIEGNEPSRNFYFFFPTKTTIDEIKIAVYSVTDNNKKQLYTYKLNHPCQHYFAAAFIKSFFNSSDCVIEKGHYHFVMNPKDTTKTILGPKFFYGEYAFKSTVLSKKGNILCMRVGYEIVKKTL